MAAFDYPIRLRALCRGDDFPDSGRDYRQRLCSLALHQAPIIGNDYTGKITSSDKNCATAIEVAACGARASGHPEKSSPATTRYFCSPVAADGPRRQPLSATFLTPTLVGVPLLLAGLIVADRNHIWTNILHCVRIMTPTSTGLQHGNRCFP